MERRDEAIRCSRGAGTDPRKVSKKGTSQSPCWTTLWLSVAQIPQLTYSGIIVESRPILACLEVPHRALGSVMAVVQNIVIRLDE